MVASPSGVRAMQPHAALLFELEYIGFDGRRVAFDVLKSLLADKDVALTPALFARYCVDVPIDKGLPRLLKAVDRGRLAAERLIPDFVAGIRLSHIENSLKPDPLLLELVSRRAALGMPVGAVSDMDTETAEALAARFGLEDKSIVVFASAAGERRADDAKSWLSVARTLKAAPQACVGLATSSASRLAILAAGMRCAAVPDAYTAFQDFGGVDRLFEPWDKQAVSILDGMLGGL